MKAMHVVEHRISRDGEVKVTRYDSTPQHVEELVEGPMRSLLETTDHGFKRTFRAAAKAAKIALARAAKHQADSSPASRSARSYSQEQVASTAKLAKLAKWERETLGRDSVGQLMHDSQHSSAVTTAVTKADKSAASSAVFVAAIPSSASLSKDAAMTAEPVTAAVAAKLAPAAVLAQLTPDQDEGLAESQGSAKQEQQSSSTTSPSRSNGMHAASSTADEAADPVLGKPVTAVKILQLPEELVLVKADGSAVPQATVAAFKYVWQLLQGRLMMGDPKQLLMFQPGWAGGWLVERPLTNPFSST
jgi:hypothetical protein